MICIIIIYCTQNYKMYHSIEKSYSEIKSFKGLTTWNISAFHWIGTNLSTIEYLIRLDLKELMIMLALVKERLLIFDK